MSSETGPLPDVTDEAPAVGETLKKKRRHVDLLFGVVGLFLQVGTGLIMLPLTATMLAPAELTFWTVFLSIQAMSYLIEFGFTPSFARNFTYVLGGANRLVAEGVPPEKTGAVNRELLCELLSASRTVYMLLSFVVAVVLAIGGSIYVDALARTAEGVPFIWESWALFAGTLVFHTYMNWQAGVVMGADRMREYYQIVTVARLVQVALSVVGLLIKPDLLTLTAAYAVSALVMRVHYQIVARNVTKLVDGMKSEPGATRRILSSIAPNAVKIGWVTIGGYLTSRFSFLVISLSLGAAMAAEYAVAQQAFFALAAISQVAGHLNNARMTAARLHSEKPVMREIYAFTVLFAGAVFLSGALGMMLFGERLLEVIGSQTLLPPLLILATMTVIFLLDVHANIAMGLIATSNSIPYMRAVLITGVLVAGGTIIVALTGGGLQQFILVQGAIQLAYNFWRWPMYVCDELGLKLGAFAGAAVSGARRMLFDRM